MRLKHLALPSVAIGVKLVLWVMDLQRCFRLFPVPILLFLGIWKLCA
jgi:hypothetical protein